jgi:hypothetical protein
MTTTPPVNTETALPMTQGVPTTTKVAPISTDQQPATKERGAQSKTIGLASKLKGAWTRWREQPTSPKGRPAKPASPDSDQSSASSDEEEDTFVTPPTEQEAPDNRSPSPVATPTQGARGLLQAPRTSIRRLFKVPQPAIDPGTSRQMTTRSMATATTSTASAVPLQRALIPARPRKRARPVPDDDDDDDDKDPATTASNTVPDAVLEQRNRPQRKAKVDAASRLAESKKEWGGVVRQSKY